jgi:hypothetical protein
LLTNEAQKNRGCIAASPKASKTLEGSYLFFFLAFFFAAILFSSHSRSNFAPARLPERVSKLMYSDCAACCQEESDSSNEREPDEVKAHERS